MLKIVMICQPWFNRGDESAHKALIRRFLKSYNNVKIKILYVDEVTAALMQKTGLHDDRVEYVVLNSSKSYFSFWRFGLRCHALWYLHPTIWKIRQYMKWADYVLCAPGGMNLGGFRDWYHLFWLFLAKQCKKRVIYYGRSIGPFVTDSEIDQRFCRYAIEIAHKLDFVSIRDKRSQNYAEEIGLPYFSTTDSAFLDDPDKMTPDSISNFGIRNNYMVFVPNYLLWHAAFKIYNKEAILGFYIKIIEIINRKTPDINIVMLPQCFGMDRYEFQDVAFFREIKAASSLSEKIIVLDDKCNSDVQQYIIHNAKYLIGARYHSVVFSINQNTPFIALTYEHKMNGLLEIVEKTDCAVDISTIFGDNSKINNALEQVENLIPVLAEDSQAKEKAKAIADECFESLKHYIELN